MKIAIANDMPLAVEMLRRALSIRPDLEIVWIAADGQQAVDFCQVHTPDVILMDLIMASTPCAILIVTADSRGNASRVYEAMGAGALDVVDTPSLAQGEPHHAAATLLAKIDAVAGVLGGLAAPGGRHAEPHGDALQPASRLVAIGASAGGPAAVATLLSGLPKTLDAAIVVVQHVDAAFAQGMADWLAHQTGLPVRLACEGDVVQAGQVLLAGSNDHLHFRSANRLGYIEEPCETPYRPSVDVLFESIRANWRGQVVAVLLTGMGRDGAQGLKALRDRGCHTIAQDQASSAVYGMPKAAAALGAAREVLPLDEIAAAVARALK
jgi:two-component system chemotaxis response regulator CheB/two-component system response regulator WspF